MTNIYLLYDFNNYYDRKVIKYSDINGYTPAGVEYEVINNVINFNYSDGVDTEFIANITGGISDRIPNYLLITDENDTIKQRWFITDNIYVRDKQYRFVLRRDVIADTYDILLDSPVFIEKGILSQADRMIFNDEGISVNQILSDKYTIPDATNCPWIVGYMTTDHVAEPETIPAESYADVITYSTLSQFPFYNELTTPARYTNEEVFFYEIGDWFSGRTIEVINSEGSSMQTSATAFDTDFLVSPLTIDNISSEDQFCTNLPTQITPVVNAFKTLHNIKTQQFLESLKAVIGKVIYISDTQKYYQVGWYEQNGTKYDGSYIDDIMDVIDENSSLYSPMMQAAIYANNQTSPTYLIINGITTWMAKWSAFAKCETYRLAITEIPLLRSISYTIPDSRRKMKDTPYTMFAMPYGSLTVKGANIPTDYWYRDYKTISMRVAQAIASKYGGNTPALYDLQLLPYFPVRELLLKEQPQGEDPFWCIDLNKGTEGIDYTFIKDSQDEKRGLIFWARTNKGSFTVNDDKPAIDDNKLFSQTVMYRLRSPNYAGSFDYNPAKNGNTGIFDVDFTYKPYSPYIHINPFFSGLYGGNYHDARGLICEGKFDLPQTSDAWATYERNNVNYNNIFNREISHLETTNNLNVAKATLNGLFASDAAMMAGYKSGGESGAAIAGASALTTSIGNIRIMQKQNTEDVSYTKAMHYYQMKNIRALPDGLTSAGALTNNNTIWPVVEIYKCTDEEKEALKDHIRYEGMTVNRIDRLRYLVRNKWVYSNGWNFFKGQLIQSNGIDNSIITKAVNDELNKGIYIKQGG